MGSNSAKVQIGLWPVQKYKGKKGDRGPEKEREAKGDRDVGAFPFCNL